MCARRPSNVASVVHGRVAVRGERRGRRQLRVRRVDEPADGEDVAMAFEPVRRRPDDERPVLRAEFMSTSAHTGQRLPFFASMTTTGESCSRERRCR
jgi:hypothetical protein